MNRLSLSVVKFISSELPVVFLLGERRKRTLWRGTRARRELRGRATDGRHDDVVVDDGNGWCAW